MQQVWSWSVQKLRVGVLLGGMSIENEVSFNSGRTVCDHLDTQCYDIIPLFHTQDNKLYILPWRFLHRGKITDFIERLATEARSISWDQLKDTVDFMYIATHGRFAEDGLLQGMLEVLNIPYLGSKVLSSAVRMDKIMQKAIMQQAGVRVPRYTWVRADEVAQFVTSQDEIFARLAKADITFPCIIKPQSEGSSLGVAKVISQDQLQAACEQACYINGVRPQNVVVEECIEGMEFSCIILTDYHTGGPIFLPPTEIVIEDGSQFFDYEQKYMPGRAHKYTPARCSVEITHAIQQACYQTMLALDITNMSRIDGFVTSENEVVIIDPNSLSGMGPSSFFFKQAAEINMNHTDLINHVIKTELHFYGLGAAVKDNTLSSGAKQDERKRVAVLLGGRSAEREISLESGRNVVYKLSPQKYEALPLFLSSELLLYRLTTKLLVCNTTQEIEEQLTPDLQVSWQQLPELIDFIFIALHGGEGENGCVQGTLELLGLPYNGSSVLASALCMDKYKTNQLLKAKGFAVPDSMLIGKVEWDIQQTNCLEKIMHTLPFPLIVKPHDDGCSVGVQKVTDQKELAAALQEIFQLKATALIEVCVVGMELTVGVIGNNKVQALPPSQAVATGGILSIEEKFLPGAGENQTPAPLDAQATQLVQRTVENVYSALGCKGYARIDCFYQDCIQSPTGNPRVVILEINTLPGLTPATCIFHQAAEIGIKPMEFIDKIVQFGFEQHCISKILNIARPACPT